MTESLSEKIIELQSTPDISGSVLPSIFKILALWSFSFDEQIVVLGLNDEHNLDSWIADPGKVEMTDTLVMRASYLLGIFKSLQILLPDSHYADNWLNTPNDNPLFGGAPPKSHLLTGKITDLATVRHFLNTQEAPY